MPRSSRRRWSGSGARRRVAEIALPHAEHGIAAYYVIAPAEASSNLARYDGVRYGLRAEGDGDLIDDVRETRARGFGDEVKRRIMLGTFALSSGYYDAYYGQAQKVRTKIAEDFAAAFAGGRPDRRADLALGRLQARREDGRSLAMYMTDYCTVPMTLAGIPAISIPAGLAEPGAAAAAAGRLPDRGAGIRRAEAARRRIRARAGDRLRRPARRRSGDG